MTRFHLRHRSAHAARHVTHSPHHDTKTAKTLKAFLIICICVLSIVIIVLGYLTFVANRTTSQLLEQTKAIDALLDTTTVSAKPKQVISSLGFSVAYDTSQFMVAAQTTDPKSSGTNVAGVSYNEAELSTVRPYSIVKISAREDEATSTAQFKPPKPTLSIVTNIRKEYWDAKVVDPANAGLSKLDILAQLHAAEQLNVDGVEASSPEDIVITGTPYKKITYTTKSQIFGKELTSQDIVYLSVQNDRPYTITISPVTSDSQIDLSMYEAMINSITYDSFDANQLSLRRLIRGRVAGVATISDLPSSTTKTPYDIEPSTIIGVILRNQPAVVRVATSYCSDIDLLLPNGTVGLHLDNACQAFIGSGSIISKDGFIATNGHVATVVPANAVSGYSLMVETKEQSIERITTVLKYMLAADLATDVDVNTLLTDASNNDAKAITILSTLGNFIPAELIKPTNESLTYAIQTSSKPIQYNIAKSSFVYSDTVIPAKLIAKNFDANQKVEGSYNFGTGTSSDVALLKANGTFPVVQLGSTANLEEGDDITAIGFPAFTDGGLMTTKSKTPPTVTQGVIKKIENEQTSGLTLLYTNVPIAQGFSGGPTFSKTGKQVGLNTYSLLECDDQECFGDGVARDVADLKALLATNKVTLQTSSAISDEWQHGLNAYSEGNYRGAVKIFDKVSDMYPAHYLASSISKVAVSKYNSPSDTSDGFFTPYGFVQIAKVLGTVVLISSAGLTVFLVNGSRKHGLAAHYRTGAPAPIYPQQLSQNMQQPLPTPQVPAPVVIQPLPQAETKEVELPPS